MLVHTDWAQHWGTERYFEGHPYLTAAAATYLKHKGARLVGIDSLNIDDTVDGTRPVHTILLGAGIPSSSTFAAWTNCPSPVSHSAPCHPK